KAKQLLLNFFSQMYSWELKNINCEYTSKEESKLDLDKVFSELCTIKERKNGRQISLNYRNPPEYDSETQIIRNVIIDGKKAVIETERTVGLGGIYRYHLIEKNGEYRIDKKEMYDSFDKKWIKSII